MCFLCRSFCFECHYATKVTLLYGNKTVEDILLKVVLDDKLQAVIIDKFVPSAFILIWFLLQDELDLIAQKMDGKLKIVYVVGESPDEEIDTWHRETSVNVKLGIETRHP